MPSLYYIYNHFDCTNFSDGGLTMEEKIWSLLKQLEEEHQIKTIYACEGGSRAWGIESDMSDYDVRFIYVHPTNYYLSIDPIGKKRDVMEEKVHNIELSGWELTKALRLIRKSNPTLYEWIYSPIRYIQFYPTINRIRDILPLTFNPKSCILHYVNMARKNYSKANKETEVNVKNLLNIVRPILAIKWIETYQDFPPVNFQQLVDEFIIEDDIKFPIQTLINSKRQGNLDETLQTTAILQFTQNEMSRIESTKASLNVNRIDVTERLNQIFRDTLNELEYI